MLKRSIYFLFVFILLVMGGSSCSNKPANSGSPNTNSNTTVQTSPTVNPTSFPPLASAMAEADIENLDGTKYKVSSKKGKVVLLNIWGTWCGPCRQEMPTLMALQDKYRDKGFEVIGLNIGDGNGTPEPNEKIENFVQAMKLNYAVARIGNATTREFNSVTGGGGVVPQTILVDREGRLRGVFVGGGPKIFASLEDTIGKVMAE